MHIVVSGMSNVQDIFTARSAYALYDQNHLLLELIIHSRIECHHDSHTKLGAVKCAHLSISLYFLEKIQFLHMPVFWLLKTPFHSAQQNLM